MHSFLLDTQEHFKQRSSEPDFRRKYTLPELKDPSHEYSPRRVLAAHLMHKDVQLHGVAHHNALDDARTTMSLYRLDDTGRKECTPTLFPASTTRALTSMYLFNPFF